MNQFSNETLFVVMWVGFLVVGLAVNTAVILWAVRNRQFARQERARELALTSGIPKEEPEEPPCP